MYLYFVTLLVNDVTPGVNAVTMFDCRNIYLMKESHLLAYTLFKMQLIRVNETTFSPFLIKKISLTHISLASFYGI